MAQHVSLLFGGEITESTVFDALYQGDSGFKAADHQPLNSNVAIAVAIVGVVVSSAQLGIQLWRLYSEAKNAGKPINVTLVSATGEQIPIPFENRDTVEKALQTATAK